LPDSIRKNLVGISNEKQPNIRHAFGGPLYRWSFASAAGVPDQEARWLYEKEKRSVKPQASSLTAGTGYYRMSLKGINMDTAQLKRIADAIEEILRLVKKDMEPKKK